MGESALLASCVAIEPTRAMPYNALMQKLYTYVDETGQDTQGDLFLVSVIVTEGEQHALTEQLETIERQTTKGLLKWIENRDEVQLAYMQRVLALPMLQGHLHFAVYHQMTEYFALSVASTARAIRVHAQDDHKAIVLVDGLPKSLIPAFGRELRHYQVRTHKVRGVRKEEGDALMRLADALAGFVRDAKCGKERLAHLLEKANKQGIVRQV